MIAPQWISVKSNPKGALVKLVNKSVPSYQVRQKIKDYLDARMSLKSNQESGNVDEQSVAAPANQLVSQH